MKIENLSVREVRDSLGRPTIEVGVEVARGAFSASVPSGKSKGSREAMVRTPAEAKELLNVFQGDIAGKDFPTIKSFDGFLIALDGTENKSRLGGNLTLGLSLAFARALGGENGLELWQVLRQEFFSLIDKVPTPRIFSNFVEGGAHAKNNLDIQEFWVVAEPKGSVSETVRRLSDFFGAVGETLRENGLKFEIGDEDGYSLDFPDNFGPLDFLGKEIERQGRAREFLLGIDVAASSFYEKGFYRFERKEISSRELESIYSDYFKKAPLLKFIEDPFDENDEAAFVKFSAVSGGGRLIIGDDFTVTDPRLIGRAAEKRAINGVIIKPNQVGTVSETCAAMNVARDNGLECVVSHRSGETADSFLVHFAKAAGAYGVKIGAPVGSRLPKFEELIRLYS
jgi:enolase